MEYHILAPSILVNAKLNGVWPARFNQVVSELPWRPPTSLRKTWTRRPGRRWSRSSQVPIKGERSVAAWKHGGVTGLLAGVRVHLLDGAHGSVELACLRHAHGHQIDVRLPAHQQGGVTHQDTTAAMRAKGDCHPPRFSKEHLL